MNISGPHTHQAQHTPMASQLSIPGGGLLAGPGASGAMPSGTSAEATTQNQGLSPQERLDRYAAHIESRLDNLEIAEESSGLNLNEVRDAFRHHIGRLQDAMATGELSAEDLANGIQNAVNLVRDGVREAMDLPTMRGSQGANSMADPASATESETVGAQDLDVAHSLERLQAVEDHIRERLANYMANSSTESQGQVQDATDQLLHNFDRMRSALESGSMSLADITRSIENTMEHLAEALSSPVVTNGLTHDPSANTGQAAGENGESASDSLASPDGRPSLENSSTLQETVQASVQSMLADFSSRSDQGLNRLFQQKPHVQQFLSAMQQDSRQARGLGVATYNPAAQVMALQPDVFGNQVDFAV